MIKVINSNQKYKVKCPTCNSELEFEKEDVLENWQNYKYITCPNCERSVYLNSKNYNKVETTLGEIRFPEGFDSSENGVEISDKQINEWIKEALTQLKKEPETSFYEISSGDTAVIVLKYEDNTYSVYVCKGYYQRTID